MNSYHINQMAASIAAATGAPLEKVTAALNAYWSGKIAAIWCREDMLGTAFEQGYAVTDAIADDLLAQIEDNMDAELGICWLTLRTALQDADHSAWFREVAPVEAGQIEHWLTDAALEKYAPVTGRFQVWRWLGETHEAVQEIFGIPEEPTRKGSLVEALQAARKMTEENEGEPVFIACLGERSEYDELPDLAVYHIPGDDQTRLVYARDLYTGKEHRRTAAEVISIAASLGITLSEDETDAILDEVEGETEVPFDVTDNMISRCIADKYLRESDRESMDGDAASALASAGFGKDEDYQPAWPGESGE
jgi:hypothetical protein